MEKQIKKLNELALDFVDYGIGVGLQDTHNTLTNTHKLEGFDMEVNIYFANSGSVWSITMCDVEITGYSSKITLPINSTLESLNEIHKECKKYLDYLIENVANIKYSTLKEKAKKIQELKKEIDNLRRY